MEIENVIFLGAGASKAEGAPLQGELLQNYLLSEAENDNEGKLKVKIERFFKNYFGIERKQIINEKNFPTFEEVLGILEIALNREEVFRVHDESKNGYEKDIRQLLILSIALILDKKLKEDKGHHRGLVKKLADADLLLNTAFISFNYDILIDNALASMHKDPSCNHNYDYDLDYCIDFTNYSRTIYDWHRPHPQKSVKLLKLHGSLNWLYCPTCISLTLTPRKKGVREFVYQPEKGKCQDCEKMMVPIIVPPSFFKVMSNYHLQQIWHQAEKVLRDVKRLFFCGYFFPDADIHVKYLLKRAELYRNKPFEIFIVNGGESNVKAM